MKQLGLLGCALFAGCSELTLDLLEPGMDAAILGMDAAVEAAVPIEAALPAEAAAPLDAGRSGLILRYDFAGNGTELRPRVGTQSAFARGGAQLDDSGTLQLDGTDDYVDLPNRSLASLESATIMTWVSWGGGVCWQRAFDFGFNDADEGMQGTGASSLFVTFSSCPGGTLLAMYEQPGIQFIADTTLSLAARPLQLALAFDGAAGRMRLYLDGARVAETNVPRALAQLDDDNAWLGRSQWVQDRFTRARYDEFRLYDRALTDDEIEAAFARGADSP